MPVGFQTGGRMKNVSLTYFVDFVLKAGTPKLTVVQGFKQRGEYDPATVSRKASANAACRQANRIDGRMGGRRQR